MNFAIVHQAMEYGKSYREHKRKLHNYTGTVMHNLFTSITTPQDAIRG